MFDCEYFEKLLDIYAEHIIYKIFIYIIYLEEETWYEKLMDDYQTHLSKSYVVSQVTTQHKLLWYFNKNLSKIKMGAIGQINVIVNITQLMK